MARSVHSFAKQYNLSKSTVYRYLIDLGYDLSQGMNDAAEAEAYAAFVGPKSTGQHTIDTPRTRPEAPDAPTTYRAGGLVPVGHDTRSRTIAIFDAQQYQQDKQHLESTTRNQAASLNDMVAAYAQSRIASVLADIDLVADSLRANALQEMGTAPGKRSTSQDGNAA